MVLTTVALACLQRLQAMISGDFLAMAELLAVQAIAGSHDTPSMLVNEDPAMNSHASISVAFARWDATYVCKHWLCI